MASDKRGISKLFKIGLDNMSKEDKVEKGYCNFDLVDFYKTNNDEWKNHEVRINEIEGFKRTYPVEGVRKINILV